MDDGAARAAGNAELVTTGLAAACARHFGAAAAIAGLRRLTGGASRETWSFDAEIAGARHPLILRRDPPRRAVAGQSPMERSVAVDRPTEFAALKAAHDAGVAAPEPLFMTEPGDGIGGGYVMRRAPGTAIARQLMRDPRYDAARPRFVAQLGEQAARIHAMDVSTLSGLRLLDAPLQIAQLRRVLDALDQPHPVFELALSRLARRPPPRAAPRFVHGDFRTGNFLADETGVTAILDWELPHLGDPMEDLGWMCIKSWRFGAVDKPAGGFGSREALWAAYEAAGGGRVDPARALYWEMFGTVRWGVICLTQAWKHLSGAERSMELCAIGRRAAETEVDLVDLLKRS